MAKTKKGETKKITKGKAFIQATFNNTIVSFTDMDGNVLVSGSAGGSGFKGTRKSTPFAATTAVEIAARKAAEKHGLSEVEVFIKGPGQGRDASLRALKTAGLKMSLIADVTPMPHNGPRPKKRRRA
jgi:small subunit ribosomal protein S11